MKVVNLTYPDIEKAIDLSAREFGKDFHHINHLKKFIDSDNKQALIARHKDKIVGLLLVEEMNSKDFNQKLNGNTPSVQIDQVFNYIDTILVDSEFQKKGVGSLLLSTHFEKAKTKLQTIAIAWKNTDGLKVTPLFIKFGFNQYNELFNLWDKDCNQNKYECAYKKDVCMCTGVLFLRKNDL